MFVIQVDFKDGVSQVESAYINRLLVKIGTRDSSHLILDGISKLPYEITIMRGLGESFTCKAVWEDKTKKQDLAWEKEYQHTAQLSFPDANIFITCVPCVIAQKIINAQGQSQPLKELELATSLGKNIFPAFISTHSPRVCLSIPEVEELFIGNTRSCFLRFDVFKEKKEYARVNKISDKTFEFTKVQTQEVVKVNNNLIDSKVVLHSKDRIGFSSGLELIYVTSEHDLKDLSEELPDFLHTLQTEHRRNLRAIAGPIAPAVLPLYAGLTVSIGRDPGHNVWIDAPFISRLHCTIHVEQDGYVFTDFSTNGIEVNGKKLVKGKQEYFPNSIIELSFGHGTTVLVSDYDEKNAKEYLKSNFVDSEQDIAPPHVHAESLESSVNIERSHSSTSEYEVLPVVDSPLSVKPEQEEKIDIEPEHTQGSHINFEDYQKRSLRILEESGAQFLAIGRNDEDKQEFPIRIGYAKYLPQLFIVGLIFVIVVFLVILATNLVH